LAGASKTPSRFFSHGYISRTQPDHIDFPADWVHTPIQTMHRSIFVGSRTPLALPTLVDSVPAAQETYKVPPLSS